VIQPAIVERCGTACLDIDHGHPMFTETPPGGR
jgi:hypothetical protein